MSRTNPYIIALGLVLVLCICSASKSCAQLNIEFDTLPDIYSVNSSEAVQSLGINYGVEDSFMQVFHLFLPDTLNDHPLVIFIHGGGFVSGTPDIAINNADKRDDIKYFLDRNIAYASVGYRLINPRGDSVGLIKSLLDAKRALQFIKYHSESLFVDPLKIALSGSSAGAGTSLWLATASDLADQSSVDLILRESTEVCAAGLIKSQATYDLYKWETVVYHDFDGKGTNYTVDSLVDKVGFQTLSNFYGGVDSNYHFLHEPSLIEYRKSVDMLEQLSPDDPPLYIGNSSTAIHPSQDINHHPSHAFHILESATAANITGVRANIPALGINTTQGESINRFLERSVRNCTINTNAQKIVEQNEVVLFPNPAHDIVKLVPMDKWSSVVMIDMNGKMILSLQELNMDAISIDLSTVLPGVYIMMLTDHWGQITTRRFIVHTK